MRKIPTSGIYRILNLVNGKFYIGSAVNLDARWYEHKCDLGGNRHHSPYLQRAWNKYGKESFQREVLEIVLDKNDLIRREQYYIDTLNPEYNIARVAGSSLGVIQSVASRAKRALAGRGRKHSEETRRKISLGNTGKVVSAETRAKIGAASRGRIPSAATREKLRLASTGRPCPTKGRPVSTSTLFGNEP